MESNKKLKYSVSIHDAEYNWAYFYILCVENNNKYYDNDEQISKLLNLSLEEYRKIFREKFGALDIYTNVIFEYLFQAEIAKNWLQQQLIPLNVTETLMNE